MALLKRGRGKTYYERSVRVGKKVHKQYIGSGAFALFAAEQAAELKARRQAITQGRRSLEASYVELDHRMAEFNRLADLLTSGSLLAAGYHKPPGRKLWRKHKYGQRRRS